MSAPADALVERLFTAALGTFDLAGVYLGDRLGYCRSLVDDGPATPDQLAARTGTDARYAREWLEQQRSEASSRSTTTTASACPMGTQFTAPGDDIERFMYGWSITTCLPDGRSREPSVATGTVMRPDTLRRYAGEAGFGTVEVLPVENDFFRFYRLRA